MNAQMTAGANDSPERATEARRQVHAAMYQHALQHITDAEHARLLSILRPCCPELFVAVS